MSDEDLNAERVCSGPGPEGEGCTTILRRTNTAKVCDPCWNRLPLAKRKGGALPGKLIVTCRGCGASSRATISAVMRHGGVAQYELARICHRKAGYDACPTRLERQS